MLVKMEILKRLRNYLVIHNLTSLLTGNILYCMSRRTHWNCEIIYLKDNTIDVNEGPKIVKR